MPIEETALRGWLRQRPQPHHLVVIGQDGEKQQIELTAAARNRWKAAEQAVLATEAVTVQCLTKDGKIIRAKKLSDDDNGEEEPDETREVRDTKAVERQMAGFTAAMAAMMREQGVAIREAYKEGALAANSSQEHLVGIVENLAVHHQNAIASLHAVAVNFANTMQAIANNADPPSQHDQNTAAMTQLAMAALSSGVLPGISGQPPKPNGKGGT